MSDFLAALSDYRYLKNRGYPHKAALKVIGDHYRLSRTQRNCLFRGVADEKSCARTRDRIVQAGALVSQHLGIDWFNVMITIESYLKGFPLFLADDGVARDSSSVHGSYRITQVTERATNEILSHIDSFGLAQLSVFLDSPISHSGDLAHTLRLKAEKALHIKASIEVVASADYPLKGFPGVVSTSDSVIIDHAERVFDLARHVILNSFGFDPPRLDALEL